jgi:hypothetical protein
MLPQGDVAASSDSGNAPGASAVSAAAAAATAAATSGAADVTQCASPTPEASGAREPAPNLCPLTLCLRPPSLEAEFRAMQGGVAAAADAWTLPLATLGATGLLLLGRDALDADGGTAGKALRRRHLAAIAATAGLSLATRAWLGRAPASYVRWRDAHMAAQRALRAAFLLVRSGQRQMAPANTRPCPASPLACVCPPPTPIPFPQGQTFMATLTPAAWQEFVTKKTAAAAADPPLALAATIVSLYSIWVGTSHAAQANLAPQLRAMLCNRTPASPITHPPAPRCS